MKNKHLADSLNEIDDRYLADASTRRVRRPYWLAAVAAVLVLVITLSLLPDFRRQEPSLDVGPSNAPTGNTNFSPDPMDPTNPPEPTTPVLKPGAIDFSQLAGLPDLLRSPVMPELAPFANYDDFDSYDEYRVALKAWQESQNAQYDQPEGYADSLTDFFRRSITEFLSAEENSAYSPVNVYLAMAMLAETTAGDSRQQILDLFGAESIEQLRTQAGHMWNAHYNNDGQTTLLLANSLWLDARYSFHSPTVDRLANDYYASVFGGDLGTDASNAQLQAWLNSMTGGLLEEQSKNTELTTDAVFALASTIYFKAGWAQEFQEELTKDEVFHAAGGDVTAPFMHNIQAEMCYYGSNFRAICLELTGNNRMWIILPDEGITVAEVLAGEEYLTMTLDPMAWPNKEMAELHIGLPKFDVSSKCDLIQGMKNLGLSHIFDPNTSDFTPMTSDSDRLFVSQIDHAARVVIDEKGVIAAAYTVIEVSDEGAPPQYPVIEFTADRPFLFIVSSQDNLPLFAGTVTNP